MTGLRGTGAALVARLFPRHAGCGSILLAAAGRDSLSSLWFAAGLNDETHIGVGPMSLRNSVSFIMYANPDIPSPSIVSKQQQQQGHLRCNIIVPCTLDHRKLIKC